MAFLKKTDYFELTATGGEFAGVLVCTGSNRNGSQGGVSVGKNDKGDATCADAFRHSYSFDCTYKLKAAATSKSIKIGGVHAFDTSHKLMTTGFSISTSNSAPTTFGVSGIQVEDGATDHENAHEVTIAALTLRHHAQDVFGVLSAAATRANANVYMQTGTFNGTCDSSVGTITDPDDPLAAGIVSSGLGDVRIEATFSFAGDGTANGKDLVVVASDSTETSYDFKLADGWVFSAPVSSANPEEDHPTFTFSAVKHILASS